MNTNKISHSVIFASVAVILFLILVLSTASAASSLKITETRITTNPSNSEHPAIYSNTIVWQDDRNGNWDIYIFDISTHQEIHTTNKSNQTNPAIYGNKVVWQDDRNGGSDIYLQDLSTKKQNRVTTSGKAYNPRINGNRIVWQDNRKQDNWDIFMYNISTGKEIQITTNESNQTSPDIFGDRIVWQDDRNIVGDSFGHPLLYMYNVSTSVETPLDYGEGFYYVESPPRIYGDRIVWMAEGVGTNYNIYMYDLSTSRLTLIFPPQNPGYDSQPAIYGNRIVWTQGVEPGNMDIIMYDISTSAATQITTNKYSQSEPAIYGDRIVWKDDRNGNQNDVINYDIYIATLSPKTPAAVFSSSPTSGYVPLKVQFTDKSTGSPISRKWSFGDNTYSTVNNPVHTYSKTGKYTVSLTVKNATGSNTATKSSFIIVNVPKTPIAAFSAFPTSGKASLKVQFTDKSVNSPTSWKWSFGDGKYSTQKNPAHTYSKAGKYIVSLTVKNAKGSNTKTISNYVTVK
jgi:beta propeller repeat protein